MDAGKILQSDLLDILFEHRNQQYGAYELRKNYHHRMLSALVLTGCLALVIVVIISVVPKATSTTDEEQVVVREWVVRTIKEKAVQLPKFKSANAAIKKSQERFVQPVIKPDPAVNHTTILPVNEITNPGVQMQQGVDEDIMSSLPEVKEEKAATSTQQELVDEKEIIATTDVAAYIDQKTWVAWLQKQLQPIVQLAVDRGALPGSYTVQVKFIVEKDGTITDARAMSDPGFGLAKGAVQALLRGPKWTAGMYQGKKVRSYHTQPITFVISEEQ